MMRDVRSWDEMEETGLRLRAENPTSGSMPAQVTACCWDPNSPGMVGLCGADGSFVVVRHDLETDTIAGSYAVYFKTLPVHLWGRKGNANPAQNTPPIASAPARRLEHAWSQVTFVPGHPGELLFVQGWSNRVLLTGLPEVETRQFASARSSSSGEAGGGRLGLLDGSRVVALDGHEAQVRCLAIDSRGVLLLSGDESGTICARLLHRGPHGSHHGSSAYPSQRPSGAGSLEVDVAAKVVRTAHEGGVLAVSHVEGSFRLAEGDTGGSSALFISGGDGGVVRLWRATAVLARGEERARADSVNVELHVQLLTDMLVGGFQVSCLASSLSYQTPLVLAGTAEGTLFAFKLRDHPPSIGGGGAPGAGHPPTIGGGSAPGTGNGDTKRDVQNTGSCPADGQTELGVVVMKFQHTSRSIDRVSCSREQELIVVADANGIMRTYRPLTGANLTELIAVADADGIIRTYRPLTRAGDSGSAGEKKQSSQCTDADQRSDAGRGAASGAAAVARPFELIVECRLGARSALCDFASERRLVQADGEKTRRRGGEAEEEGEEKEEEEEEEVLRTCTREGNLRIWPTTSLPTHPIRPPPPQSPPQPPPLPSPSPPPGATHEVLAGSSTQTSRPDSHSYGPARSSTQTSRPGTDSYGSPAAAGTWNDQENRDPLNPFARWPATDSAKGRGTKGWRGGEGGEEVGEEPIAREEAPLPEVRPAAPRRVSFAPADQVYELQDPYYNISQGMEDDDEEEEDYDGDFEAPRPPPPAPTPASHPNAPRRLRQTWGGAKRGGRARALDDGAGARGNPSALAGGEPSAFVSPSKLQEASLWSTAREQAALERRMREEFDAGAAPEPAGAGAQAAAAAAATVVNIPPRARTFEGLVPVSLDAPPPRPKRKGKQVSKEHLSRVQQQRISEEDLLFEGMEPAFSSMKQFGSSGMWPHAELEWYGSPAAFAVDEDSSVVSDRVWSLGRRP